MARSGWNHVDWGRIMFSNKSRFQLRPDDNRRRVWSPPEKRAGPAFIISLLHAKQALNQELWSGVQFLLTAGCLWSSLEAHLQRSGNVDELARQLEKIWQEMPQEITRVLYHFMPLHVAACI
ncbi:transposable element Tc1 transposase [Trichonephila clavipes]|uniref:Transposable element Tc1 transposase n=1 Tax=Trichonephila clavipes TaxID=2585209 RepID=A0A8X6S4H3_TRICX|nr:transposable element Tc1 transposase [Trichonephila clavipes]